MFYDENGKHVRTKKEILDAGGNIRPGCYIIPKGHVYDLRMFEAKESCFKADGFLDNVKEMYCELINELLPEEQQMAVFDPHGPYLPTKKIGKNNPMEAVIKADNEIRQEWNQTVDRAIVTGVPEEDIVKIKQEQIKETVGKSIEDHGDKPELFATIIYKAIRMLECLIRKIFMEKSEVSSDNCIETEVDSVAKKESINQRTETKFVRLETIRRRLNLINAKIHEKEETITTCKKALEAYTGIDKLLKRKEIDELRNKINACETDLKKLKRDLSKVLIENGYKNAKEFYQEYNWIKKTRNQQRDISDVQNAKISVSQPVKNGIHKRLKENKEKSAQQSQKNIMNRKRTSVEL